MKALRKSVCFAGPNSAIAEKLQEPDGCFYVTVKESSRYHSELILSHSKQMVEMDELAEQLIDVPWLMYAGLEIKGKNFFNKEKI